MELSAIFFEKNTKKAIDVVVAVLLISGLMRSGLVSAQIVSGLLSGPEPGLAGSIVA